MAVLNHTLYATPAYFVGVAGPLSALVAFSSAGQIYRSANGGETWSGPFSNPLGGAPLSIAWNGSQYLLANETQVAYSADGVSWTPVTLPAVSGGGAGYAWAVWSGAEWVVGRGGGSNTVSRSTNGASWANHSFGGASASAGGIAWDGSRFVLLAFLDGGGLQFHHSANGSSWTAGPVLDTSFGGGNLFELLALSGSIYVAYGNSLPQVSTDGGATWGNPPGIGRSYGAAVVDGVLIYSEVPFGGPSRLLTTNNGVSWEEATVEGDGLIDPALTSVARQFSAGPVYFNGYANLSYDPAISFFTVGPSTPPVFWTDFVKSREVNE